MIFSCVNDYLFTINCTLRIAPSLNTSRSNSSYWLTVTHTFEKDTFVCALTNTNGDYFCSVKTSDPMPDDSDYFPVSYTTLDTYEIALCHNQEDGSETCEVLDSQYTPFTNIRPNAPCCLTVSHNSSQHHFTWKNTYEKYFTSLAEEFKYQLQYFKRGVKHNNNTEVVSHDITTAPTVYSVDDQMFVPGTEYAARVRSSPNLVFYKGQWSDWSSEVHWKIESAMTATSSTKTFVSELGKVFISLCVMVPLILLLCYAPMKKWRQNAFIPTPAPYFHTLYTDCQGDFKSWVVTKENTTDMLKAEATLQIDTLTKCADVPEEDRHTHFHHQLMEGSSYSNIIEPVCDNSLLGIPYAVSTMAPLAAPESSLKSLALSSQSGSPAEGDSGCWLCSDTSLEKDSPWYCNEYCTLSTFQQSSPVTAAHHGSLSITSCPQGIIGVDAIGEE
ncbi:interleukin-21 receptor [Lates calcarifer]|uniref:Interleukin-21 receptor n=1 Tax=Lates calcarifer TaxID=8187 RepID=A0A4W6G1R2_LATCA|nr:interleukin-21 receptor [Lates calcarifer]